MNLLNLAQFSIVTRKRCSETNTKVALCYRQSVISNLIQISKFTQGLFYIMQHFRDNEKKQLKMTVSLPFWILFQSAKFIMDYPWVIFIYA